MSREGFAGPTARLVHALDLRYLGQQWDITVAIDRRFDTAAIRRAFEKEHDRLFGHIQPGGIIEITKLRVTGIGTLPRLAQAHAQKAQAAATPSEHRKVWIDARSGWQEVPVYRRRPPARRAMPSRTGDRQRADDDHPGRRRRPPRRRRGGNFNITIATAS